MAVFADIQYCSNAEIVGGSENIQKYVDLIYGWSQGQPGVETLTMIHPFCLGPPEECRN